MEFCHTVDRIACRNGKMRHLDLSVTDNTHAGYLTLVSREAVADLDLKTTVDLLNDLVNSRQ